MGKVFHSYFKPYLCISKRTLVKLFAISLETPCGPVTHPPGPCSNTADSQHQSNSDMHLEQLPPEEAEHVGLCSLSTWILMALQYTDIINALIYNLDFKYTSNLWYF
jgi:hypothetical protein